MREHNGRYVVIKDRRVIGSYVTEVEAVNETARTHELGTFLVQLVSPGADAYTQVFHSRVAFAR